MNNSIDAIKSAARILRDEAGNVVVQLPLEMWDTLLQQIQPIPQHERLKALLLLWEAEGDTGLDDECAVIQLYSTSFKRFCIRIP